MKKFISLLLCISALSGTIAFAEKTTPEIETAVPTESKEPVTSAMPTPTPDAFSDVDNALLSNTVTITADIEKLPFIVNSTGVIELFDKDGKSLGKAEAQINDKDEKVVFTFNIPTYKYNEQFKAKIVSGIDSILYYEDRYYEGTEFCVPTYYYYDDNGRLVTSSDISVTIRPMYNKSVNVYYNGIKTNLDNGRIIEEHAMVPLRAVAEAMGFSVRYDNAYRAAVVSIADKSMFFNVDNKYTTVFGNDIFAPYETTMIDDTVYVHLRTLADAVGSGIEIADNGISHDVYLSKSSVAEEYFAKLLVNQWGIASRTNYMVWVSLSEYKVRLYEGKQYQWKPILEAPCAIGAPGTPTVTGSYEYNYKSRWDYGSYYVGPCLVFYRGYALHSVLLNQNGTEYDGRVGVKISHGCIRLKKKDIDFIAKTIPVGTRIYITP